MYIINDALIELLFMIKMKVFNCWNHIQNEVRAVKDEEPDSTAQHCILLMQML